MASTIWKGYISFGLISIPVRLFAAARTERISFHQIHAVCDSRIKQQLYCPTCERVIERSELVKGFEVEKGVNIVIEDEDIKKIAPESQETMEILEFVKLEEIDPLFFDASYYATPEDPGRRAYQLLLETMEATGYAAVAKLAMHQREYTVIIRPRAEGLTLHTMFYANEVRAIPEYGQTKGTVVKPQEIQLAEQLVQSLAATFDAEKYSDSYQKRLEEMIETKREGKPVTAGKPIRLAPVIDLMAALQKSLGKNAPDEDSGKKPAARTSHSSAPRKRKVAGG